MPKLNLRQPVLDLQGNPVLDEKDQPVSYEFLISTALNGTRQGETLTPEVKTKIFQAQIKLYKTPEVSFTVDQMSLIKDRAGVILSPLFFGRICQLFDPAEFPEEKKEEVAAEAQPAA